MDLSSAPRPASILITLAIALAGCEGGTRGSTTDESARDAQAVFWTNLSALCGNAYEGVISANEGGGAGPDPFEGQALVMHVRTCTESEIRIPFQVGDDRSRTWVITRTPSGLRLKHDHRHEDGSPDAVTMYGGDTAGPGSVTEQRFPADAESRALFVREGLPQAVDNTWILTLIPGVRYGYALVRPAREFRVDFDLTRTVEPPLPPWGE
jgi:hypothetical protein